MCINMLLTTLVVRRLGLTLRRINLLQAGHCGRAPGAGKLFLALTELRFAQLRLFPDSVVPTSGLAGWLALLLHGHWKRGFRKLQNSIWWVHICTLGPRAPFFRIRGEERQREDGEGRDNAAAPQ